MDENWKETFRVILKFIFAAIVFVCSFILYKTGISSGDLVLGPILGFISMGLLIGGAIMVAFPIAQLLARSAGKIFYSSEKYDRPQPMYSIPEGKRKSGHFEEAFEGFQKIATEFPKELKPYIEMMDIAIVDMKDKKKADRVFHQAIATLDNREDCNIILKMYQAISSRLDINPSATHHPVELKKQTKELSEPDYFR